MKAEIIQCSTNSLRLPDKLLHENSWIEKLAIERRPSTFKERWPKRRPKAKRCRE